jgi:hypothetical protein
MAARAAGWGTSAPSRHETPDSGERRADFFSPLPSLASSPPLSPRFAPICTHSPIHTVKVCVLSLTGAQREEEG